MWVQTNQFEKKKKEDETWNPEWIFDVLMKLWFILILV